MNKFATKAVTFFREVRIETYEETRFSLIKRPFLNCERGALFSYGEKCSVDNYKKGIDADVCTSFTYVNEDEGQPKEGIERWARFESLVADAITEKQTGHERFRLILDTFMAGRLS